MTLRSRVVVYLSLLGEDLVKTTNFSEPKYVGDPLNTVRILNDKEVDEVAFFDIGASERGTRPNFALLERLSVECRMPLCYGGGISSVSEAQRLVDLGVEKVSLNSAARADPYLVASISEAVGRQSVAVTVDVRRRAGKYLVCDRRGAVFTDVDVVMAAREAELQGAGEFIVNDADRDGSLAGFDLELALLMRSSTVLPISLVGGAASRDDLRLLDRHVGPLGVGAASIFVFKGKRRAVLVSYPSSLHKAEIVGRPGAGAPLSSQQEETS
jgi:cyclase